jgi:hypothetical protein
MSAQCDISTIKRLHNVISLQSKDCTMWYLYNQKTAQCDISTIKRLHNVTSLESKVCSMCQVSHIPWDLSHIWPWHDSSRISRNRVAYYIEELHACVPTRQKYGSYSCMFYIGKNLANNIIKIYQYPFTIIIILVSINSAQPLHI